MNRIDTLFHLDSTTHWEAREGISDYDELHQKCMALLRSNYVILKEDPRSHADRLLTKKPIQTLSASLNRYRLLYRRHFERITTLVNEIKAQRGLGFSQEDLTRYKDCLKQMLEPMEKDFGQNEWLVHRIGHLVYTLAPSRLERITTLVNEIKAQRDSGFSQEKMIIYTNYFNKMLKPMKKEFERNGWLACQIGRLVHTLDHFTAYAFFDGLVPLGNPTAYSLSGPPVRIDNFFNPKHPFIIPQNRLLESNYALIRHLYDSYAEMLENYKHYIGKFIACTQDLIALLDEGLPLCVKTRDPLVKKA